MNDTKGISENIDEASLVQKILRYFTKKFNPKVSAIEELSELKTIPIDQLLGTLKTYEMRIGKDNSTTKNHPLNKMRTLILKWTRLRKIL